MEIEESSQQHYLRPSQQYQEEEEEEEEEVNTMQQQQQPEHQQQEPEPEQQQPEQPQQRQQSLFTICIPIPTQIFIYITIISNFLQHVYNEFNETFIEVYNCLIEIFMEPIFDDITNLQDLSIGLLLVEQIIATIPLTQLQLELEQHTLPLLPSYILSIIEFLLDGSVVPGRNLYYHDDIHNNNNNNPITTTTTILTTATLTTKKVKKRKILEKFEQFISRSFPSSTTAFDNNNHMLATAAAATTTTTTTTTTNNSQIVTSFLTSPLCLILSVATIFAIVFKATSTSSSTLTYNNNPLLFRFLRYQTTSFIMYILVILFCFESILVISILILAIHSLIFPYYIEENIYMLFILSGLWTTSLMASSIVRYNLYQSIGD